MIKAHFFTFLVCFSVSASSVKLLNDSPFKLDAVVINALGQTKGELTLNPQEMTTWYYPSDRFDPAGSPITPFTVIWYCPDGSQYGIWVNVPAGSLASAQSSSGQRMCKIKKPKPESSSTDTAD